MIYPAAYLKASIAVDPSIQSSIRAVQCRVVGTALLHIRSGSPYLLTSPAWVGLLKGPVTERPRPRFSCQAAVRPAYSMLLHPCSTLYGKKTAVAAD